MRSNSRSDQFRGLDSVLRRAAARGDHEMVIREARHAVARASEIDDHVSAWQFSLALAEGHLALDEYRELREVAGAMAASPAASDDPVLRARSLSLLAIAQRCEGQLGSATSTSEEALALLQPTPDNAAARAQAYQTLIAALVEADRSGDAWSHQGFLAEILSDTLDEQTAGKGFWTLGNLAFMVGDADRGLEYHARASRLLSPANDILLWSRFNKASADLQLLAGIANDQTGDCIERAMLAQEVMNPTDVDRIGLAVTRARWHNALQRFETADEILGASLERVEDPNAAYLVPAYRLWAEVLESIRPADAADKRAEANRIEGIASANPS